MVHGLLMNIIISFSLFVNFAMMYTMSDGYNIFYEFSLITLSS